MNRLELAVDLFGKSAGTKEVAFLNGVLFGYGSHLSCPIPNWELIKEYSEMIDIEKKMREIFEAVHKQDIDEAKKLLQTFKE